MAMEFTEQAVRSLVADMITANNATIEERVGTILGATKEEITRHVQGEIERFETLANTLRVNSDVVMTTAKGLRS